MVRSYVPALAAIALWATNALVASRVLTTLPVEQVQVLQFAGAALVFALAQMFAPRDAGRSVLGLALGVIGVTGTMMFQYFAFAAGPIAQVNIIAYAWPLLVAVLAVASGRIARPGRFLVLTILGFFGAALVLTRNLPGGSFGAFGMGPVWALLSALCMATYSAAIGRIRSHQGAAHLAGATVGLILAAVFCARSGLGFPEPAGSGFWLGLYLGIGPIGLGYLFWARAMKADPTGRTAALGYLTPVASTALLMSVGATMPPLALLGGAIVVACCALTGFEADRNAQPQR